MVVLFIFPLAVRHSHQHLGLWVLLVLDFLISVYWNGKDLIEAEEIKKRWQGYTELYKKSLNDLNNHNDVVTHLGPDILECEVK